VYIFTFERTTDFLVGDLGPYGPNPQTLTKTMAGPSTSLQLLRDGAGTLNLEFDSQICPASLACHPLVFPSVAVGPASVVLQVTGTPVREPDELVLLLGAIPLVAGLIKRQRTKRADLNI
jgi:hypothetical protein